MEHFVFPLGSLPGTGEKGARGAENALEHWTDRRRTSYLEAEEKGRLVQSLKSYLPNRTLTGTEVFGRRYMLEDLVSRILSDLRGHAERQFGTPIRHALVGRPVSFVGAETEEDDAYAVARLRDAFTIAGFKVSILKWSQSLPHTLTNLTLDHDELILIGDFGGGNEPFLSASGGLRGRVGAQTHCAGPAWQQRGGTCRRRLRCADRSDPFPALGADSHARSLKKISPAVPSWIYANLERRHYLSFLRTRTDGDIEQCYVASAGKNRSSHRPHREDLGDHLHQAVQRVKCELSRYRSAEFCFRD